jgi:hypothetical protein
LIKHGLTRAHLVLQRANQARVNLKSIIRNRAHARNFKRVQRCLTAHATTTCGVKVALQLWPFHFGVISKPNLDNILSSMRAMLRTATNNAIYVRGRSHNAFAKQKSRGKFIVISRSAHGYGNTFALPLNTIKPIKANFQWLLKRDMVQHFAGLATINTRNVCRRALHNYAKRLASCGNRKLHAMLLRDRCCVRRHRRDRHWRNWLHDNRRQR